MISIGASRDFERIGKVWSKHQLSRVLDFLWNIDACQRPCAVRESGFGPSRHFAAAQQSGCFWREVDINRQAEPAGLVASDPSETFAINFAVTHKASLPVPIC
jgi:hypothetical protein